MSDCRIYNNSPSEQSLLATRLSSSSNPNHTFKGVLITPVPTSHVTSYLDNRGWHIQVLFFITNPRGQSSMNTDISVDAEPSFDFISKLPYCLVS